MNFFLKKPVIFCLLVFVSLSAGRDREGFFYLAFKPILVCAPFSIMFFLYAKNCDEKMEEMNSKIDELNSIDCKLGHINHEINLLKKRVMKLKFSKNINLILMPIPIIIAVLWIHARYTINVSSTFFEKMEHVLTRERKRSKNILNLIAKRDQDLEFIVESIKDIGGRSMVIEEFLKIIYSRVEKKRRPSGSLSGYEADAF